MLHVLNDQEVFANSPEPESLASRDDFFDGTDPHPSRKPLAYMEIIPLPQNVVNYDHQYPLQVKIIKYLDPNDYEIIVIDKATRGRDLKAKIRDAFELGSAFNVLIFYHMYSATGVKRRMLTDRSRIEPILSQMPTPEEKAAFDYSDFVEVSVNQAGSKEVVIRIFDFDLDHLRAQIEKHFEVRGTDYKLLAAESWTSPKSVVEPSTLKDFCINGFHFFVERPNEEVKKKADQQIPRSIKKLDATEVNEFDVMISYSWATKDQALGLCDALTEALPGIKIWVDRNEVNGNVNVAMARGILKSSIMIVCLSVPYLNSWYCNKEINFADENKKPIIPAYMFGDLTADEIQKLKQTPELAAPFIMSTGRMYSDFGSSLKGSPKFEVAVKTIVDELRILIPRFRAVSPLRSPPVSPAQTPTPLITVPEDPLKKWVKPINFSLDLASYKKDYVPGTRVWLGNEVIEWAETTEESAVMWVSGAAGTGKSLLSYYIINHLPQDKFITDVFFFCRHNDEEKNNPAIVIRTLIWMLCQHIPALRKHVDSGMKEDEAHIKSGRSSILLDAYKSFEQLIVNGFKTLTHPGKTVLITIDALDELNGKTRSSVLRILSELVPKLPSYIKFFVTGRPEKDIYDCLTKVGSFELEPSATENMADIRMVVANRFKKIWGVEEPFAGVLSECLESVVERSEGVFIFVKVVCEYLRDSKVSPEEAMTAIEGFSAGPDDVYDAIAKRVIDEVGSDLYHNVFGAILFVSEPLDLESLSILAATPLDPTCDFFDKMRSLLRIIDGDVSVIHKSVKDYFTSKLRCDPSYYIDTTAANLLLATSCLDILASLLDASHSRILPKSFSRNSSFSVQGRKSFSGSLRNSSISEKAGTSSNVGSVFSKITSLLKKYGKPMPGPKTSTFVPAKLDLSNLSTVSRYAIQNLVLHLDPTVLPPNIEDFLEKYGPEVLLHLSARSGSSSVAVWLLQEKGADIEAKDAQDKTPLQLAVENRHADMVEMLLDNGAQLESKDAVGWTALHGAAWNGQRELVQALLNRGADGNAESMLKRTPLHIAAWSGDLQMAKMLVAKGSQLEIRDTEGKTPLIMAAEKGQLEVVSYLLDLGANIMAHGIWGQTSLHRAAENGHLHVIKFLVAKGAIVPISDFYGRTSVSTAAFGGHTHVIQYLLEHGASVDTEDANGMSPLHEAAKQGHKETVEFLLAKGARVNAEDKSGRTPLYIASLGCHKDIIQELMDNGAAIDHGNQYGESALFLATAGGHVDVVQTLLEMGANVDVTNSDGDTPCYIAASVGLKDIVQLLVHYGANPNAVNARGDSVLQAAIRGGHLEVVYLFREKGAVEKPLNEE